jgi:hypothetical protein
METTSSWQDEFQNEAANRCWLKPLKAEPSTGQAPQGVGSLDNPLQAADWTEEEVVHLHWRLLERIKLLRDTRTPLEEKIEILHWMFTDAERDKKPFSFVNCVRVVGVSPLSPTPCFIGVADAEEVRDWVRCRLKRWLIESLENYPMWVRNAIVEQPGWIALQLERNPQWLNEQIRRNRVEGDLFA